MIFRFQGVLVAFVLSLGGTQMAMSQGPNATKPDINKPGAFAYDVALSLDGETLAAAGDRIRLFESVTGQMIEEKIPITPKPREGVYQTVLSHVFSRVIRFSTTENDRYASGSDDGFVRVWRVGAELPEKEFPLFEFSESDAKAGSVAHPRDMQFSPDGNLLAAVAVVLQKGETARSEFRLWNLESGEVQQSLRLDGRSSDGVAFSPQGTKLAIATSLRTDRVSTGSIEIYDMASWQLTGTIPFGSGFAGGMAYSPDGEWLWIGGGECIPSGEGCRITGHLRRVRENGSAPAEIVATDPQNYFRKVSLSNDGSHMLTGSSQVQLRHTSEGALKWSYLGTGRETYGASLSSHGEKAAFCQGRQITILDATTGKLIKQISLNSDQ